MEAVEGGGIEVEVSPRAGLGCCIARTAAKLRDNRAFAVISHSLRVKHDPGPPVLLTGSLEQEHLVRKRFAPVLLAETSTGEVKAR